MNKQEKQIIQNIRKMYDNSIRMIKLSIKDHKIQLALIKRTSGMVNKVKGFAESPLAGNYKQIIDTSLQGVENNINLLKTQLQNVINMKKQIK